MKNCGERAHVAQKFEVVSARAVPAAEALFVYPRVDGRVHHVSRRQLRRPGQSQGASSPRRAAGYPPVGGWWGSTDWRVPARASWVDVQRVRVAVHRRTAGLDRHAGRLTALPFFELRARGAASIRCNVPPLLRARRSAANVSAHRGSSPSKTRAPRDPTDAPALARLPIEELARRTGVTVRNLRQLQTHGVLEPPELEGRKGFYTPRHLARVALVRRLQDRGYSIAAIRDLLQRWQGEGGSHAIANLEDALEPPPDRGKRRLVQADLFQLYPEFATDRALRERARKSRLIEDQGDTVEGTNAELLELGRSLVDTGIGVPALLELVERLDPGVQELARVLTGFFEEQVVEPFRRAGWPVDGLEDLAHRAERMRKLAARAVHLLTLQVLESGVVPAGRPTLAEGERSTRRKRNRGR
jgi:DNA-binding transcriptional MerR regulator